MKNWIVAIALSAWMIALPSSANVNPDGRTTTKTTKSGLDAAKVVVDIARAAIDSVPLSGDKRHASLGCEDMISWFFTSRNCAGGIYTRDDGWVMMVTGEDHDYRPARQARRLLPGSRERHNFTQFGERCAVVYAASPNAGEYPLYVGTGPNAPAARDAARRSCVENREKCYELLWGCNGWQRMGIPPFRPAYSETIQFIRLNGGEYAKCGDEPGIRCRKR